MKSGRSAFLSLLRFHLGAGARLAARVVVPVVAAAAAAATFLGPDFLASVARALFGAGAGIGSGAVVLLALLGVARAAAPRVCRGLSGWVRHAAARGWRAAPGRPPTAPGPRAAGAPAEGRPLARAALPGGRRSAVLERLIIRCRQVSFGYRSGAPVLAGVDLAVLPGLTLLLGPNGCGKSTLLGLLAGIEVPDAGSIEIDGHDLWVEEVAARRTLAYVPEQPDLTPYASIQEILDLVCRLRGEPTAVGGAALARLGLGHLAERSVRELSMGQRRRAVLAAALVGAPRHVLLDEPLETLDRGGRDDVLAWIDGLAAAGAVVLVVSHDLEPFVERASRALTLRDGRPWTVDRLPASRVERWQLLERLARGLPAEAAGEMAG